MKNWRCWFKHRWEVHQHNFLTDDNNLICIAWKQCERCAHSKLIHILG